MRVRDEQTGHVYDDGMPISDDGQQQQQAPRYQDLFDAPNYADLVRPAQTREAKEYSDKVRAMLKSGVIAAINIQDFPDAAAILTYGPAFADATGQLAAESESVAKAVDLLMSPASAPLAFALTAGVLVAQLVRNHEPALKNIPESRRQARLRRKMEREAKASAPPRFTIRVFGRQWPVRFETPKIGKVFNLVRAQTRDPENLTVNVFTDQRTLRALAKHGIILVNPNEQSARSA